MARYTRKQSTRRYAAPRRSSARSYGRSYQRSAPRGGVRRASSGRAQRVEVVLRHVMQPSDAPAGYVPGVPGLVGVANVPPVKKGKTF